LHFWFPDRCASEIVIIQPTNHSEVIRSFPNRLKNTHRIWENSASVMFCELTSNPGKYLSVSFQRKSHLPMNVEPEASAEGIALQKNSVHGGTIQQRNLMPQNSTLENVVAGVSNCRGTGHLKVLHYRGTGYLEIPS
jgi:hypothetical protein